MSNLKSVPVVSGVFTPTFPAFKAETVIPVATDSVVIYYGSQSGTAEAFSRMIYKELQVAGIPSRVEDLDKFAPKQFTEHKLVILVVATTGEGDATDNAKSFNRFLASKSTPHDALSGMKYCVFGLGDLNYINFNHMGKRTEKNMERLGAVRIHPRGIGDASQDIEADLRHWIDSGLLEAIRDNLPNLRRTGSKPVIVLAGVPNLLKMIRTNETTDSPRVSADLATSSTLSKVFYTLESATLVARRQLRQTSLSKLESTCEITLTMKTHNRSTVEILPANSEDFIQWAWKMFPSPFALDETIDFVGLGEPPFPVPCTLRFALTYYIDLQSVGSLSRTFLSNVAVLISEENEALTNAVHEILANTSLFKTVSRLNLMQFLSLFDVELEMSEFLQVAPKQKTRPYTCAGSTPDGCVNLVVALTSTDEDTESILEEIGEKLEISKKKISTYSNFGVCSSYLCDRVSIGATILCRQRPSVFSASSVEETPMLAICTGAGIAPFIAWMRENTGPAHLVFGCRDFEADFLYRDEILAWQAEGRIVCNFAFSKNATKKHYVQDIVKQEKEIHRLIDLVARGPGGRILVCGRTCMGRAVCEAIAAQLGGQIQLEQLANRGALTVEFFG